MGRFFDSIICMTAAIISGPKAKEAKYVAGMAFSWPQPLEDQGGRAGEIRTHDFLHPMQALYQAELQPVTVMTVTVWGYAPGWDGMQAVDLRKIAVGAGRLAFDGTGGWRQRWG